MAGASRGRRIRVASYNVHSCVGADGVFAPERIAGLLRTIDADFVALQEVEEREYGGLGVSAYLKETLALHEAGRTMHKRAGIDYGNVLLSRVPPAGTVSHDLAIARREPRGAIESDFDVGGYRIRVVASHFGLSMRERREQLRRILPCLESGGADLTVLCADFNEWSPWSGVHRRLRRVMGAAPAVRTFPSRRAALPLDRIYASPLDALVNVEAVATAAARQSSDHLPVVADFDCARLGGRPG